MSLVWSFVLIFILFYFGIYSKTKMYFIFSAGLWSAALIFYVVGLYTLKFIYVSRIQLLNQHPMVCNHYVYYVLLSLLC